MSVADPSFTHCLQPGLVDIRCLPHTSSHPALSAKENKGPSALCVSTPTAASPQIQERRQKRGKADIVGVGTQDSCWIHHKGINVCSNVDTTHILERLHYWAAGASLITIAQKPTKLRATTNRLLTGWRMLLSKAALGAKQPKTNNSVFTLLSFYSTESYYN